MCLILTEVSLGYNVIISCCFSEGLFLHVDARSLGLYIFTDLYTMNCYNYTNHFLKMPLPKLTLYLLR